MITTDFTEGLRRINRLLAGEAFVLVAVDDDHYPVRICTHRLPSTELEVEELREAMRVVEEEWWKRLAPILTPA